MAGKLSQGEIILWMIDWIECVCDVDAIGSITNEQPHERGHVFLNDLARCCVQLT